MEVFEAQCGRCKAKGRMENGVMAFHGVRYADDPGNFEPVAGPAELPEELDATEPAAMFPQANHPIDLAGIDGEPLHIEQSTGAFLLNIWTPDVHGEMPVVFWIHGGGYSSGGCELPTYNGSAIARDAGVVFVGVNYRLGAYGNMLLPGVNDENLALLDLLAAFEWVRLHIGDFGGDPGDICLMGQSAGAWYACAMLATGRIDKMFSRAMLMSCPSSDPLTRDEAAGLTEALLRKLKMTDRPQDVRSASPKKMIQAQRDAAKESKKFGVSFLPFRDDVLLGATIFDDALKALGDAPLMIGSTSEETSFFVSGMYEAIERMSEQGQIDLLAGFCHGSDPKALIASYRDEQGLDDPYLRTVRITTDQLFTLGGKRMAASAENSYMYGLGFASPNPAIMATHCMDLPFVFDNFEQWGFDAMLDGIDMSAARELQARLRPQILSFLASGSCDWPTYAQAGVVELA